MSFTHVGGINTLLLLTVRKQSIAWIHHNIFVHSPTLMLALRPGYYIMLLYMNMYFHFSWVRDWVSGIAGTYGRCLFNISENYQTAFQSGSMLHSHEQCMSIPMAPYPSQHLAWTILNLRHFSSYVVISHCAFILQFPNDSWCWATFQVLTYHSHIWDDVSLIIWPIKKVFISLLSY